MEAARACGANALVLQTHMAEVIAIGRAATALLIPEFFVCGICRKLTSHA